MLEALLKQENIQYDLEAMLTEGKIKAAVPVKRTGQWDRRESMSEIQDAAQIIKVSFEGAEIILKMGNTGWQFVKDICAVFKKVLDQEKLSGKTSVQKLLKMGGDLQVFRFETKDLERVKALANKYGILYSILPDLNEKDGMSEILFHSQAAPRIQSMMAKIEHSNIGTLDEYYENAEPDKVEQLVEEVKSLPCRSRRSVNWLRGSWRKTRWRRSVMSVPSEYDLASDLADYLLHGRTGDFGEREGRYGDTDQDTGTG